MSDTDSGDFLHHIYTGYDPKSRTRELVPKYLRLLYSGLYGRFEISGFERIMTSYVNIIQQLFELELGYSISNVERFAQKNLMTYIPILDDHDRPLIVDGWRYFIMKWTDNGNYRGQELQAICRCPRDTVSLLRYGLEIAWVTNFASGTDSGRNIGPSMTTDQFLNPNFDWNHINNLFNLVATAEWAAGLSFATDSLGWGVIDPALPAT